MIFDLRPMILDDLGLVPTLRRYMSELGRIKDLQYTCRAGRRHDLELNATLQIALFRMVQSILAAILAEGSADTIDIHVDRADDSAKLRVEATSIQTWTAR